MREVERIANQLRRAFEGEAWHGPALSEILSGVSADQAAKRPVGNTHTMWELVLHIEVWESVVRRRLGGERIDELSPAQDWPAMGETTAAAWEQTRARLDASNRALQQEIGKLKDEQLSAPVPGKGYSIYDMLHGVVQHDLYHAGQIALLKKALA